MFVLQRKEEEEDEEEEVEEEEFQQRERERERRNVVCACVRADVCVWGGGCKETTSRLPSLKTAKTLYQMDKIKRVTPVTAKDICRVPTSHKQESGVPVLHTSVHGSTPRTRAETLSHTSSPPQALVSSVTIGHVRYSLKDEWTGKSRQDNGPVTVHGDPPLRRHRDRQSATPPQSD